MGHASAPRQRSSALSTELNRRPLGDAVPPAVAGFYAALEVGDAVAAAGSLSADVLFAVPPTTGSEVDARVVAHGREAAERLLAERAGRPRQSRILVCIVEDGNCLLEGVEEIAGTPTGTFVASLQLDPSGLVKRHLAYGCQPAVVPGPRYGAAPTGDAAEIVGRYFNTLDEACFDEAADCFSADVLYSHPPYRHTGIDDPGRVVFKGRAALLAGFRKRGKAAFRHQMTVLLQRGPNCLFELVVPEIPVGSGGCVSTLSLDDDGLIQRYAAFYSEPAINRR